MASSAGTGHAPALPAPAQASVALLHILAAAQATGTQPESARSTLAGAALLAELSSAPVIGTGKEEQNAHPEAGPAEHRPARAPGISHIHTIVRSALTDAFSTPVGPSGAPALNLAALARGSVEVPVMREAGSVAASGTPSAGALPGAGTSPAIAPGIELLRRAVAQFPVPALPPELAERPVGSVPAPISADRASGAAPSPALGPAAPAPLGPELPALPAVQNTFNVTVHVPGGVEGEEALAARLTRILVEQARQHGIDV
jgi:hypothetical protein